MRSPDAAGAGGAGSAIEAPRPEEASGPSELAAVRGAGRVKRLRVARARCIVLDPKFTDVGDLVYAAVPHSIPPGAANMLREGLPASPIF